MDKLKISCVNYTNSLPFSYGLEHYASPAMFSTSLDTPAECYRKLENGDVDLGLVPVVALNWLGNTRIVSPYCIGAKGKVKSVIMASSCKIKELEKIYLDYQSRTSVELVKILASKYWQISPEFISAHEGIEHETPGKKTGFVIIGDRSFHFYQKSVNITDLAQSWYDYTGKPFVFACWISRKNIDENYITPFNEALAKGLDSRSIIARESAQRFRGSGIKPEDYFFRNIQYNLDNSTRAGMELFLNLLQ